MNFPARFNCEWTSFITPTFESEASPERASRMLRRFGVALAQLVGSHLPVVVAVPERLDWIRNHGHLAVATPSAEPLCPSDIAELWPWGNVQTIPFHAGSARYLSLHDGGFACGLFCPRPPRCRHPACIEGAPPEI